MLSARLTSIPRQLQVGGARMAFARSRSTTATPAHEDNSPKAKPFSEIPSLPGNALMKMVRSTADFLANRKTPHLLQQKYHRKFGPIVRQRAGVFDMVMFSDVAAIQEICRQEGKYPERMPFPMLLEHRRVGKHTLGVFLSEGEDWLRQRRVVNQHMMKIRAVESHIDDFNDVADDFLQRLLRVRSPDNLTVPQLDDELFSWSLESGCTFLLEQRLGCLSDQPDPKAQEFISSMHEFLKLMGELFIFPPKFVKRVLPGTWKRFFESGEAVWSYAHDRIRERLQQLESSPTPEGEEATFLEYLIRHPDTTAEEAMANVTEFLGAAIDTTASSVLFTVYELARNPEIQQRMYEEVTKAVPPGSELKAADLQKMPFLKAVIKESMRMYPITGGFSRIVPEDCVIMGYQIPKRTILVASLYAVGRSESVFPEPETFRPERWLRDRGQTGEARADPFASLPFGFGPRMCVGRRIAELEMQVLLSKLVSRFRVEAAAPFTGTMPMMSRLLLIPAKPVEVRLVDR